MPPVGFEPTVPANERPQTHALDRAATGTGNYVTYRVAKKSYGTGIPTVKLFCASL